MAASTLAAPSSPEASRRMQRVRQKDTSAESALPRELHASGLRYGAHGPVSTKSRRVGDLAFVRSRVAVFVDHCFSNGCPARATCFAQNVDIWPAKIVKNQECDRDIDARLRTAGRELVRRWAREAASRAASRIAGLAKWQT